jgi:SOS-response transcriptional repressor LexA
VYESLRASFGRRPTLNEFYRAGASVQAMRQQYGSWFECVKSMGDLAIEELALLERLRELLRELEVTQMTKSFKMILLEAFLELDGLRTPPSLPELADRSWSVLRRRPQLLGDLATSVQHLPDGRAPQWQRYWRENPVDAWTRRKVADGASAAFQVVDDHFALRTDVPTDCQQAATDMIQELIDFRLATYERRQGVGGAAANVIPFPVRARQEVPFFPNLKIACGHFRTGKADANEHVMLPPSYGALDPHRHFIARASGNSMDGGKNPIRDGDYLLLELVSPSSAGSITGTVMAIERQDGTGDNQYLLRLVANDGAGGYVLKANNPAYGDMQSKFTAHSSSSTLTHWASSVASLARPRPTPKSWSSNSSSSLCDASSRSRPRMSCGTKSTRSTLGRTRSSCPAPPTRETP